jgi:5-methylcytosine-specific restriction endonuclease McrA
MRKIPKRGKKRNPKPEPELCPDGVAASTSAPPKDKPTPAPEKPARVEPTAPARYKVTFTANAELHDKLERLRALMRSSVPDGDLATIIEEAVTEKLERLESKRYGKTKAPRKSLEETDTAPSSRYIPAAVRRAVYKRDQGQCAFVSDDGRRCTERNNLEFHHNNHTYGRGGHHVPSNLTLMCRIHNTLMAERDYGKEMMERYRKNRRPPHRVSEPLAVYTFGNRATRVRGI